MFLSLEPIDLHLFPHLLEQDYLASDRRSYLPILLPLLSPSYPTALRSTRYRLPLLSIYDFDLIDGDLPRSLEQRVESELEASRRIMGGSVWDS